METYIVQKETRKNNRVTFNKTRKNHEIRKERERLSRERFRERMNMPIGTSSVGFPLTDEMKLEIDTIKKTFNLDY